MRPGFVVMLRPRLASNTYALTVITCAWAYLLGPWGRSSLKYGSYLGVVAMNAMVFDQYSPQPGSHGLAQYYAARVCDYTIGITLCWIVQFLTPRCGWLWCCL